MAVVGRRWARLLYLRGLERHPAPARFLQRLAQRWRVYAPELPGYGGSTGIEAIDGTLGMALYHRQLVESWGVEKVDGIGHSLGGMLAAEFAELFPHRTRRLVLVNAYGLWLDDAPLPAPFVMGENELVATKLANPDCALSDPSIEHYDLEDPYSEVLERMNDLATARKFVCPIPDRGLWRCLPLI